MVGILKQSGSTKIIALVSKNQSGMIDVGDSGDKHQIGIDADGNPINSAHIPLGAYFRLNNSIDGPLSFNGGWEGGGAGPIRKIVHFEWDSGASHPFVCGSRNGVYRWHSYCEAYTVTPPPGIPPTPPPFPPNVPTLSTPPLSPPFNPPFEPGGGTGLPPYIFQSFTTGMPAKPFSAFSMEVATSGLLARPQFSRTGELDFRNLQDPTDIEVKMRDSITPIVARLEAYGKQTSSGWVYADKPNVGSRYPGGVTPGGWALFPPQVGIEDSGSSFEPSGRNISATFLTFAPRVRLGFGLPDTTTGKLKTGMGFIPLTTSTIATLDHLGVSVPGDLGVTAYDSSGTETLRALFPNAGGVNIKSTGVGDSWGKLVGNFTAPRTITFQNSSGTVAYLSDITSGVTGSGTAGTIPKWATSSSLTDSLITESGTTVTITGKLTVTGAIDPTSILLSGGTALYYESNDGSTAGVSGAATGRLRYNNTTGTWQISTQGGAYASIGSGTIGGSGTANFITKFTAGTTIGNSQAADDGTDFLIGGGGTFPPVSGPYFQYRPSTGILYVYNSTPAAGVALDGPNKSVIFFDKAADAGAAGFLCRNGANLSWHDSTVATNLLRASLATAKGDIFVATASNAVTRLGVGSDAQVLTADSTQATGLKWATPSVGSEAAANAVMRRERFF